MCRLNSIELSSLGNCRTLEAVWLLLLSQYAIGLRVLPLWLFSFLVRCLLFCVFDFCNSHISLSHYRNQFERIGSFFFPEIRSVITLKLPLQRFGVQHFGLSSMFCSMTGCVKRNKFRLNLP